MATVFGPFGGTYKRGAVRHVGLAATGVAVFGVYLLRDRVDETPALTKPHLGPLTCENALTKPVDETPRFRQLLTKPTLVCTDLSVLLYIRVFTSPR